MPGVFLSPCASLERCGLHLLAPRRLQILAAVPAESSGDPWTLLASDHWQPYMFQTGLGTTLPPPSPNFVGLGMKEKG